MPTGGVQGIATLRLLRQIEERTGRPIRDLFDLICGTSTGGILATALALKNLTLDDCQDIYKCVRAWSNPAYALVAACCTERASISSCQARVQQAHHRSAELSRSMVPSF